MKGLQKLSRKFRNMKRQAKAAAAKAVVDAAFQVAEFQQSLAPIDDGDLRNSIEVTGPGGVTPAYSQPGGSRRAKDTEAIITAGNAKVRYAHLVEFGTAPHINAGRTAGSKNKGARAQPFFWPGYRATRRAAASKVKRAITKALTQAATAGGTAP